MGDIKDVDLDGKGDKEELGGGKGGKTVIMISNQRKKSIFNIKKS